MITSSNLNIHKEDDLLYITFPLFDKIEFVKHAFTTRLGGVSDGQFASMNMSFTNGDDNEKVLKNFNIICNAIGIKKENLVFSKQTHTDNIRIVTKEDIGKGIVEPLDYTDVDALITDIRGVGLVTQFADCTPLIFCDTKKKVIAAAHAGWRGTVSEIGRKTVEKMIDVYGCRQENIIAAIGPSICQKCYEVDDPVYEGFKKIGYLDMDKVFIDKGNGKYQLNLWEANKEILLNAGIKKENIDITDLCTNCNPFYFHSHRFTGGKRGNLASIIALI